MSRATRGTRCARAQETLDAAAGTELDPQVVQALTALLQRARSA